MIMHPVFFTYVLCRDVHAVMFDVTVLFPYYGLHVELQKIANQQRYC